jgi:hypothetical protein
VRTNDEDKVLAVFNFSPRTNTVSFDGGPFEGRYRDAFTGQPQALAADSTLTLPPWGYRVLLVR